MDLFARTQLLHKPQDGTRYKELESQTGTLNGATNGGPHDGSTPASQLY